MVDIVHQNWNHLTEWIFKAYEIIQRVERGESIIIVEHCEGC